MFSSSVHEAGNASPRLPHSAAGRLLRPGLQGRLQRIRPRPRPSPDAQAALGLLQGDSRTQTIRPGCLQGSAPLGQGLCGNGISEHTGRATSLCVKAAEGMGKSSSFPFPPHPGLQSPRPGGGEGGRVSEVKGWRECRLQSRGEGSRSSCPCPQSLRSPLGESGRRAMRLRSPCPQTREPSSTRHLRSRRGS